MLNVNLKIIMFILLLSIMLLSGVSANNGDNATSSVHNFNQLNDLIENSQEPVNLTDDYEFQANDSDLSIGRSTQIDGNGHIIDFAQSCMIVLKNSDILFSNVTFKNFHHVNLSSNVTSLNLTLKSCIFLNPQMSDLMAEDNLDSAGNISQNVTKLAKRIAGKSTGIGACKKIAQWVGKNISHETKEGFYQSPDDTLKRKKGNCCSQTLLFLQMCDAVGALEGHNAYFVHVGTMKFHHRHFFAMIDNVFVDVDAKPHSPWGNANFAGRSIYSITEYPYLSLPKEY